MKIDWRSVGLVGAAVVIGYLILKPSASAPLEAQLQSTTDSLRKVSLQIVDLKSTNTQLTVRLQRDSAVKDSLYARILAVNTTRAPVRIVPIAADSTNIVALRAENRALVAVVSELQGDLVVSQTSLETLKMTAIQLKTVDSVAYLAVTKLNKQLQQQLDSVQTTVKGAANVVRRRWYQRVWSVTKQTGTKIIIFGAGVGAGKVL